MTTSSVLSATPCNPIHLKIMKEKSKETVCISVGAKPVKPEASSKLGIALNTIGKLPINGLRHSPEKGTNGWYIWCGEELSEEDDFFSPMHIEHLRDYLPEVLVYLDLPPGYRFLIDNGKWEDIWFDELLLKV